MKFRKKPVVVEATQWLKNGDHPLDYSEPRIGYLEDKPVLYEGAERKALGWEGDIVRYFRHPDTSGITVCKHCASTMHWHGWIDTLEGGHIVCPGDWIITGVAGEHYPCKPAIFNATYEPAEPPINIEDMLLQAKFEGSVNTLWCSASLRLSLGDLDRVMEFKGHMPELEPELRQGKLQLIAWLRDILRRLSDGYEIADYPGLRIVDGLPRMPKVAE